ncbi:hypothetical protein LXL04_023399 [Taraxacum kok-saghyz]
MCFLLCRRVGIWVPMEERTNEKKMSSSSGRQVKAMLRKNWLLKIRHPYITLAESRRQKRNTDECGGLCLALWLFRKKLGQQKENKVKTAKRKQNDVEAYVSLCGFSEKRWDSKKKTK